MSTGIEIDNKYIFVPLLVDRTLNIQFEVPGLNQTVNKLKRNGYAPLDQTFCDDKNNDKLEIDVLLGVDVIQYMVSGSYQKYWEVHALCLMVELHLLEMYSIF